MAQVRIGQPSAASIAAIVNGPRLMRAFELRAQDGRLEPDQAAASRRGVSLADL
jgi:hypothetical protein